MLRHQRVSFFPCYGVGGSVIFYVMALREHFNKLVGRWFSMLWHQQGGRFPYYGVSGSVFFYVMALQ
ncbi:hypothetical protein HOY80DRAFT_81817 [Tuber brumale]|nr:hypothetical protein HOY80DRAFT_81817 [Tuber brumale]